MNDFLILFSWVNLSENCIVPVAELMGFLQKNLFLPAPSIIQYLSNLYANYGNSKTVG